MTDNLIKEITKARRSQKLTKEQKKALTVFVGQQYTKTEASQILGLTYASFSRILLAGTASSVTIEKIFSKIEEYNNNKA